MIIKTLKIVTLAAFFLTAGMPLTARAEQCSEEEYRTCVEQEKLERCNLWELTDPPDCYCVVDECEEQVAPAD